MNLPGFTAEASLHKTTRNLRVTAYSRAAAGSVQPAFIGPRGGCWQICGGDPDCMQCCLCIRRGGHPWQCCF